MKVSEFINAIGLSLSMESYPVPHRPDVVGEKWEANHWLITLVLTTNGKKFTTFYSKGGGLVEVAKPGGMPRELTADERREWPRESKMQPRERKPWARYVRPAVPTLPEVLTSLASDVSGMPQTFEEWCWEFGYDADSRKAYAIFNACLSSYAKLREFFGPEWFRQFQTIEDD
jgi:hypothetical protein